MKFKTEEQLLSDILSLKVDPIYLLYGSDDIRKNEIIKTAEKKIDNNFDISNHSSDSFDINLFLNDVSSTPLFSPKKLVILKRIEKIKKELKKSLYSYFLNPNPSTLLIITYNEELKRNEIEKDFGEYSITCIEIMPPDERLITSYIKKELEKNSKEITDDALKYLSESISNYGELKNETQKILTYLKNKKNITLEEVMELSSDLKEQNVFLIANAILSKNGESLKKIMEELISKNEQPLMIIAIILTALEKLLKITMLKKEKKTDYQTALSIGVYRKELTLCEGINLNENKILKTIDYCLEVESVLKTTHTQDPQLLLRNILYIIVDYLMTS
ncbi:MAG: DNA polymerase III subunit delta [Elusimicrobiota bacterium]